MKKGIYINDSLHGLVALSNYEKKIIASVEFNRLHDIYQNSTVFLTFPSNRTKRFEHSIGTMKLCSDMFFSSVMNASPETLKKFFETFRKEYEKIINGFTTSYCNTHFEMKRPKSLPDKLQFDERYWALIPSNISVEEKVIHLILIESIRVAALLHDVGHPPFSHVVEHALKAAYAKYEKKNPNMLNEKQQQFLLMLSPYITDNNQLHEEMGKKISESILESIVLSLPKAVHRDERIFYVLIGESVKRIFANISPFSSLHRLIDSSLDGDRLDYVTRDPNNSGMNSGRIDYSRIISDMRLVMTPQTGKAIDKLEKFIFCVPLKAVNAVEDFVRRRFNVYKDIVFHHRVIKTDCLLEYTVRDIITEYLEQSSEGGASNDSAVLPFDISGLWAALRDVPIIEKSHDLSQWNDAWLMTVLKKIYYEQYNKEEAIEEEEKGNFIMHSRLSELLLNQKQYYSLIKRSEDFRLLDDAAKEVFWMDRKNLETIVERYKKDTNPDWKNRLSKVVKELLDIAAPTTQNKGFFMTVIYKHYRVFNESKDFQGKFPLFGAYIENIVKRVVNSEAKDDINDWIVCPKSLSSGIEEPIYFYGKNESDILTLIEISTLKNSLDVTSRSLPIFYIYLLMPDELGQARKEALLKSIGREVGKSFKRQVVTMAQSSQYHEEETT